MKARADRLSIQDLEAHKAQERIDFYLAGGSRPVYISRWVLSGILIVTWVVLWLRGAW